ncbi:hypothetical protein [Burkholderia sp. JP2-270]|uniref:hypothetical protein n=1 Tax=Burkholderia sp. JP2-270 TaxID=2217913 RepID=UPI0013A6DDED|nr:hypothetical protein [Burkholderia sp. JP2-270]
MTTLLLTRRVAPCDVQLFVYKSSGAHRRSLTPVVTGAKLVINSRFNGYDLPGFANDWIILSTSHPQNSNRTRHCKICPIPAPRGGFPAHKRTPVSMGCRRLSARQNPRYIPSDQHVEKFASFPRDITTFDYS